MQITTINDAPVVPQMLMFIETRGRLNCHKRYLSQEMPGISERTAPMMLSQPRMVTPNLRLTQQQHLDTMMLVDWKIRALER